MNNFNTMITEAVKNEISRKLNNDYSKLHDSFCDFIRKYNVTGELRELLVEHTTKSLANNDIEFTVFPELGEILCEMECSKLIRTILLQETMLG